MTAEEAAPPVTAACRLGNFLMLDDVIATPVGKAAAAATIPSSRPEQKLCRRLRLAAMSEIRAPQALLAITCVTFVPSWNFSRAQHASARNDVPCRKPWRLCYRR